MTFPAGGGPDAGLPPRSISNIPVPDPSVLTTQQMKEAVANLRTYMQAQVDNIQKELDAFRHNHEENHRNVVAAAIAHRKELSDAQVAILKSQVDSQFDAIQERITTLDGSIATKLSETDHRYQQRYDAQSEALAAAFDSQQKAIAVALAAAKDAVTTALAAAEKAAEKADAAADKLIPRAEAEVRLAHIEQRMERRFEGVDQYLLSIRQLSDQLEHVKESINGLDRITDAKFVTMRALTDSQADKVAVALTAADKANNQSLSSLDKANAAALAAAERAVTKAEVANEKRFEAVDQFRQVWAEQTKGFVPRNEFTGALNSLTERINQLTAQSSSSIPREELESRFMLMSKQVDDLRLYTAGQTGKSEGSNALFGWIAGGVGLIAAVIALVSRIGG